MPLKDALARSLSRLDRFSKGRFLLILGILGLVAASAFASSNDLRQSVDRRVTYNESFSVPVELSQVEAAATLRSTIPELALTQDVTTGVTRSVTNRVGYLTQPRTESPMAIGLGFVWSQLNLLGLTAADLESYEVTDSVFSAVTGATHIYLRQNHEGLGVYNAQLHVNVNRDGRLISVNNSFLSEIAESVNSNTARVTAVEAVRLAALSVGIDTDPVTLHREPGAAEQKTTMEAREFSRRPIEGKMMWLPIRRGQARLVWNFQAFSLDNAHMYDFTVDAQSGEIWTRFDWVDQAGYRVFAQPVESPTHAASPPPADGRTVEADPANATASPLGWHDDGTTSFTTLQGNNGHAFDDIDGNNLPPAVEPDCGVSLDCDFDSPIPFGTADPVDYTSASVTNLFYWVNLTHDIQYHYGFDEAAGNFQENNFANGGLGSDGVTAFGQKSGSPCPNNAFFGTPPDGQRPNMTMCLWTGSSPRRDFSWDAGVMTHEYGHGISNRLVGGPSNVSCLDNSQQPGEGLSDWWSLAHTGEVGDQGTDSRGAGVYILGQPISGAGVRGQAYSTNPAINSWNYESINGAGAPHGVGAVWAQGAWEAYWALVDEHGFDPDLYDPMGGSGNQRMLLYVTEGLKNTACSPAFTDVRDGIIQAAVDNYGGSDVCRLWEAFAGFGLGSDAISGGSNSTSPTNGFAVPESCTAAIFADGFESGDTTQWSSTP